MIVASQNDALLAKLDPSGAVVWETTIGESSHDIVGGLALDAADDLYVVGWTDSANFPTTLPPIVGTSGTVRFRKAFVMKVSGADGSLLLSRAIDGDHADEGSAIAIDADGNLVIGGTTGSTDFPTTAGAYQDGPNSPLYIDTDGFVMKLTPDLETVLYCTYFGGYDDDVISFLKLDPGGDLVLGLRTSSDDLPLPGAVLTDPQDISIARRKADGSAVEVGTYLGGSEGASLQGMALDAAGFVYLVGTTQSLDFPTTPIPIETADAGGDGRRNGNGGTLPAFAVVLSVALRLRRRR